MKTLVLSIILLMLALTIMERECQIFQDSESIVCQKAYGDVVFYLNNVERLRIAESGAFYVNGVEVTRDDEVYASFREWVVEHKGDLKLIK